MNRVDRLTGILIRLQGEGQTAGQLAERFEVSKRTILRDIDALCQIGVPVVATTGRGGGYRIADGFWLPPMHLTPEEATVLLLALDHLGDEASSPLGAPDRTARDKLRSTLRPATRAEVDTRLRAIRVVHEAIAPPASTLAAVRLAVERRQWVEIAYGGVDGPTVRTILPTLVSVTGGRWYVRTVDAGRAAIRHFRIDRIERHHPVTAPANAAAIVARATGQGRAYDDASHPEVRVRLTPRGVIFARDHPDLRSAIVPGDAGGQLVFRCPPGELPYYGRELLRFGPEATVDAPSELRAWMAAYLGDLLRHYQGDGDIETDVQEER